MNANDLPDKARQDAVGARLMAVVENDLRSAKRRRTIVSVGGVAAVGALLAAGAAILTPQLTVDTGARCYASADLSSTFTETGLVDQDPDGSPQTASTAIELCANAWEAGILEPEEDRQAAYERVRTGYTFPVPPLTACKQNDGLTIVLPNPDETDDDALCRAVGLSLAG